MDFTPDYSLLHKHHFPSIFITSQPNIRDRCLLLTTVRCVIVRAAQETYCSLCFVYKFFRNLVKGVHIKGKAVQLTLVVGNRRVSEAIELSELSDILPDLDVVGVKDVCAVDVDIYNGPVISDHHSKKYREHGKIQQELEKETTP